MLKASLVQIAVDVHVGEAGVAKFLQFFFIISQNVIVVVEQNFVGSAERLINTLFDLARVDRCASHSFLRTVFFEGVHAAFVECLHVAEISGSVGLIDALLTDSFQNDISPGD